MRRTAGWIDGHRLFVVMLYIVCIATRLVQLLNLAFLLPACVVWRRTGQPWAREVTRPSAELWVLGCSACCPHSSLAVHSSFVIRPS